jgi:uncharacterized membrane protein YeaQ/YmgE (transglycosylase-associated protein family)
MTIKPPARESFLFVRTSFDVGALIQYQRTLEAFIDDLPNRASKWIARDSTAGAIAHIFGGIIGSMLPTVLRSNYLAAVWSLYESTVLEIAAFTGQTLGLPALHVKRSGGFDEGTTKYFSNVLGFSREPDAHTRAELSDLYKLRNAIMHGGGRRGAIEAKKWAELQRLATKRGDFDLTSGIIVPSEELTSDMTHVVAGSLNKLIARARTRLAGHV